MKIVTADEMRQIDRATSERFGVPSLTLMENAGTAVADFILEQYPRARTIGVLCGKGNNGGDGFVCARKLRAAGKKVAVLLLAAPAELRGDAATMFRKMRIKPVAARDEKQLAGAAAQRVFRSDLLVDALLGTGFKPPVEGLYLAAIKEMWEQLDEGRRVVSVDIPSGADADNMGRPEINPPAAPAEATVTFTAPRPAHVLVEGLAWEQAIAVAPIGSPPEAIQSALNLEVTTPQDIHDAVAPRLPAAHKGEFGHLLVIGGSVGKAGAAAMAGMAGLRAGAGLVTVATPKSVLPTVAGFAPEIMTEPLDETDGGTISLRALEYGRLEGIIEGKAVLAIGPGISRNPETAQLVRTLVAQAELPVVLDADGLNAFEGHVAELDGRDKTLVLTPHPGEMGRLAGISTEEVQKDRLGIARRFAQEHQCIVVLKGHRTVIAVPDGRAWINLTGNPGMASGGTGDILTGLIAGLAPQSVLRPAGAFLDINSPEAKRRAQQDPAVQRALEVARSVFPRARAGKGATEQEAKEMEPLFAMLQEHARQTEALRPLNAVLAGVYLHGLAGDLAAERLGQHSLVATSLLKFLPDAFQLTRALALSPFAWIQLGPWPSRLLTR
jgi:NAD(P)H-hydrate epimerase